MKRSHAFLLVVLLALLVAAGWWLFPSNARRIRTRFQMLATLVSVPADEQDLARLARVRRFGGMLASDVEVTFAEGAPPLTGRDTLMALVARPPGLAGGVKVELADVAVQVASGGMQATGTARARLTYTDPQTHQPAAEEHDVSLEWRKIDGEWLVGAARVGDARDE
jgi:hypothetical protein